MFRATHYEVQLPMGFQETLSFKLLLKVFSLPNVLSMYWNNYSLSLYNSQDFAWEKFSYSLVQGSCALVYNV